MPIYDFQCVDCQSHASQLAGPDGHVAICTACGGLMVRRDDLFAPFFSGRDEVDAALATFRHGLALARKPLGKLT